jgi:hypothetical protein
MEKQKPVRIIRPLAAEPSGKWVNRPDYVGGGGFRGVDIFLEYDIAEFACTMRPNRKMSDCRVGIPA